MTVPQISVDELQVVLESGAPLYDVREPNEYESGHVGGATLIPLGDVTGSVDQFQDDRRIYLICASGARSGRAVWYLRGEGLDAHNVAGGTNAWIKSGRAAPSGTSSV